MADIPIGPLPEFLWKRERIKELALAIHAYLDSAQADLSIVADWAGELLRLTSELERERNRG